MMQFDPILTARGSRLRQRTRSEFFFWIATPGPGMDVAWTAESETNSNPLQQFPST